MAASRRAPSGVDRTGLPATVMRARTWSSPGVSISSASEATGISPRISGKSRTRLVQRPVANPRPPPSRPRRREWAARGNMAPPGRSRLPVTRLRASTAHAASVPKDTVWVPDAAVGDGGGRGGELPGEAADVVGGDAGDVGHGLGRERGDGFGQVLQAVAVLTRHSSVGLAVGQHDLDHGQQQVGVGPGPDGHVLVGLLRGAGAPGIDDDDPTAPGLDGLDPTREVGCCAEAPVGLPGVGPEHQEEIGAVDVRYGHGPGVTEEEARGHVLGHLVHRAGRTQVAGAHRLDERAQVEGPAHVVDRRVAEVQGHGVAAVGVPHLAQALLDEGEGGIPRDLPPTVAVLDHGGPEPVRVLVELLERRTLGADEPVAEDVVPVPPDPLDRVSLQRDLQAAGRLAERAGPVGDALVLRLGHRPIVAPKSP